MSAPKQIEVLTETGPIPHLVDVNVEAKKTLRCLAAAAQIDRRGFKCDLALAFGDCSTKSIHSLHDKTAVLVFNVVRRLEEAKALDHQSTESLLLNTYFADTSSDQQKANDKMLMAKNDDVNDEDSDVVFDAQPTQSLINGMFTMLQALIDDKSVVKELEINAEFTENVLRVAFNHLQSLRRIRQDTVLEFKSIYNVTVLRFPDEGHEYFKLYRLDIFMKKEYDYELIGINNKHGIHAQYYCTKVRCDDKEMRELLSDEEIAGAKSKGLLFYGF